MEVENRVISFIWQFFLHDWGYRCVKKGDKYSKVIYT